MLVVYYIWFLFYYSHLVYYIWFPSGSDDKESAYNSGDSGSFPGSGRCSWRREWPPTPVFLPGESHGQRTLMGYSPWGCKESDTTEWKTPTYHIGEGNGNPSSVLAWRIPGTAEPGGLTSMGSHRVRHDWSDLAAAAAAAAAYWMG